MLFHKKPIKKGGKDHYDVVSTRKKVVASSYSSNSPPKNITSSPSVQPNSNLKPNSHNDLVPKTSSNGQQQTDKATLHASSYTATVSKPDSTKCTVLNPTDKLIGPQAGGLSRPSSAPLVPGALPAASVVSMVQAACSSAPTLSRCVSAAGRLGPDPSSAAAHPYVPRSYRNVMLGNSFSTSYSDFSLSSPQANAMVNISSSFSQQSTLLQNSVMKPSIVSSCMSFTATQDEALGQPWMESPQRDVDRRLMYDSQSMRNDIPNFDLYQNMKSMPHELFPSESSAGTSGRQVQNTMDDGFPHLDIINYLFDDEQVTERTPHGNQVFQSLCNGPPLFNRNSSHPINTSLLGEASSLRKFDWSKTYPDDGLQQDYGAGSPYDSVSEFISEGKTAMPCMNGQIDTVGSNQWQLGDDLSLLSTRSSGMDDYSYSILDPSSMASGVNRYNMFRSSNGH